MDKQNLAKLNMTNIEIVNSVLDEITKMGYTIKDKEIGDSYFIFSGEEDSICEFHIKEIPGFRFAIWNTCRFDDYKLQLKKYGVGHTWADSLEIDPRSDVVFFTQYERDLDKFKPSRSGFVYGLYRDSWQEENDLGEIVTVEKWRDIDILKSILHYMKKHHIKSVEYVGCQTRYIWEDDRSWLRLFIVFVKDWLYELKNRFIKYIRLKYTIFRSKSLVKKLKFSYGVVVDMGSGWTPRIEIMLRRKPEVDIIKYKKEQTKIDKFEYKYWDKLSLEQFDIDITLDDITSDDMNIDAEQKTKYINYINNIGVEKDDTRKILYKNMEEIL